MQLLSLFLHVWTPPPICGDEYDLANCGNKEIQCDRGCEREKGCLWEFTISMHACLWGWGGGVWKKVGGTMCVGAFDWRNANLKSHKDDFGLIWFARAAAQGYPFPPFSFNLLGLDSYSSQRALTVHMFFFFLSLMNNSRSYCRAIYWKKNRSAVSHLDSPSVYASLCLIFDSGKHLNLYFLTITHTNSLGCRIELVINTWISKQRPHRQEMLNGCFFTTTYLHELAKYFQFNLTT